MSSLQNWLAKLEGASGQTIQLGLDRVRQVGERANVLQFDCPIVMIAGTNGKGSTLAILAKLLHAEGLRVGTYTSPHLLDFKERVQVQGQCCEESEWVRAFEKIKSHQADTALTYFEFTTLAAFSIFQNLALDILVLEIGLGGRLDAVNVLQPSLAILTSIGYDHQEFLGNTLEQIAAEKAGIIRDKIPVILSKQACLENVLAITKQKKNTVYREGNEFEFCEIINQFRFGESNYAVPKNALPPNSIALALAAFKVLQPDNPKMQVLKNLKMVGRCQHLVVKGKRVILDVAHNAAGAQWLSEKVTFPRVVWASLADKDLIEIVKPFINKAQAWYVGVIEHPRAASSQHMHQVLQEQGAKLISIFSTIRQAFLQALEEADATDTIVVFGSFMTVAAVLDLLNFQERVINQNGLYLEELG